MLPTDPTQGGRTRRSLSISSDKTSMTSSQNLPSKVSPDPAYIAASAASQIVTNDHDSQADTWLDQHGIEPSGETALVAAGTLKLVNSFLDQLLYNFLSVSKSTNLAALRAAVEEVLKPKLAKDAISGADQELQEYLGGVDDGDEIFSSKVGNGPKNGWDTELVWKRTRLRCMVYSSLGDMEEEDEDYYAEQDQLVPPASAHTFANALGVVSPAVAIFLTAILEFMGEQVLVVAGQAAYDRLRAKLEKEEMDGTNTPADIADRVVVEEADMEKAALDRTMGRLWRGWKKRVRAQSISVSHVRSFSRDSLAMPESSRAASPTSEDEIVHNPSLAAVLLEHEYAATVPLPMNSDDIREIEIPGLARQSDDDTDGETSEEEGIRLPARPKSLVMFTGALHHQRVPGVPSLASPRSRKRSDSMPTPAPSPYKSPSKRSSAGVETNDTPSEQATPEAELVKASSNPTTEPENLPIDEVEEDKEINAKRPKPTLPSIITKAAAVADIKAAHGSAPQNARDSIDENEIDAEFEEPQIMTSSRISIGGRISPDDATGMSRRSSIRSASVHSLRLIEVSSPRSAGPSRSSSLDASEFLNGRGLNVVRPASLHSPVVTEIHSPRTLSPGLRAGTTSPIIRNGSALSHTRNSAGDSISEVEEMDDNASESSNLHPADATHGEPQGISAPAPAPAVSTHTITHRNSPVPDTTHFVLANPPTGRNTRQPPHYIPSQQSAQPTGNLAAISHSPSAEYGAPTLTPLREMTETAQSTSDEGNSAAYSHYAHSSSEYSTNGHAASGSASTIHAYNRKAESPTTPRAPLNNTRNSPPVQSVESGRKGMPEHLAKGQRAIHTSGSGSSSGSKVRPLRSSEEGTPERKGQSFEQLIRSDQTIQYTLTPHNMRNIEDPDSPSHAPPPPVPSERYESPRPPTSKSVKSARSSVSKYSALHSNPPTDNAKSVKPVNTGYNQSNSGARLRPRAAQARDARTDRDSIGDFADFIRSTGPVNSYDQAPPKTARSQSSHRSANGSSRNASVSGTYVPPVSTLPKRAESAAGRSKLLAREAVVPRQDISDLIDFVRSGPQSDKENHRIPRTVAPFRSTMDSDQMSGAVGGKAIDASLPETRYSQATITTHSSVTSTTALLASQNNKTKQYPVQPPKDSDMEDMMPKRKTRRVRDPYAIDLSDEEDEIEPSHRVKPIQEEESLADFLRNVPPPPEPTTTSVFADVPRPSTSKISKKKSSSSIMARLRGHSSAASGSAPPVPSKSSARGLPPPSSSGKPFTSQAPSHAPINPKYTAIKTEPPSEPMGYTPAAQGRSRTYDEIRPYEDAPPRNRVVQKSYQPREAVHSARRTNDLADFLMSSEPPSSTQIQPQTFAPAASLRKEEASGFSRMFGRKKAN